MDIPTSHDPAPATPAPINPAFQIPRDHLERHLWMQSHVAALHAGANAAEAARMADESRREFAARFYQEE